MLLSQMYQLLLLLSFVVEEGLGKGNQAMISFSQINASNTTNTLSTVHFRRAMGRRKVFGKVGGKNEISCRFTAVVMLFYGCFSCVHSILVCWPSLRLNPWIIWPGSSCRSTFRLQCLLCSQRWRWGFDMNLLPLPSLVCLPQPPPGSHIAARGCSHSCPHPHQPSLSEDNTQRTSSTVHMSSGQGRLGKERLPLTAGAAPSLPSLEDDGFHRGDRNS